MGLHYNNLSGTTKDSFDIGKKTSVRLKKASATKLEITDSNDVLISVAAKDITLTDGAGTGKVLVSDNNGKGAWTNIGTNTGDVTLASPNSGLSLTNQVLSMGTPSTCTNATTNAVTTNTHTHAISGFATKCYMQFTRSGTLGAGIFLQNGVVVTSTTVGIMLCTASTLKGASVMNANTINNNSGIDILKNGVSVATLGIASGISAYTAALAVSFSAGDFVSVRTKTNNASDLRNPQVTLEFQ